MYKVKKSPMVHLRGLLRKCKGNLIIHLLFRMHFEAYKQQVILGTMQYES